MASLVRMEDEGARQPGDRIELSEHLDDEGEVYRLREGPCDDLVRGGVFDRGKVASVFPVRPIIQVAYVRQQMLAWPSDHELPVEFVREYRVGLQRLRDPFKGIRLPDGAFQAVFPHQPPDFLPVHGDAAKLRHQHGDGPRSLRPAFEVIDALDH